MQTIVITGGTRGIGFGLAESFLQHGCQVVISGRTQNSLSQALEDLTLQDPIGSVQGSLCDVHDPAQVQTLWDTAAEHYGQINIWINNAGQSGPLEPILAGSAEMAQMVLDTNLIGLIHGSRVAAKGMLRQGHGAIYNMEGMGSDGRKHAGLVIYGTSKHAVRYFTEGLIAELSDEPILVGSIQPGMVVTDFLTSQYEGRPEAWERDKRIFNILAERVETVTPWLVSRILKNQKHGARISYSSRWKLFWRFLTAPIQKRNLFD